MSQFNISSLFFTVAFLFIGGIISALVLSFVPFALTGLIASLLQGIIQILVLSIFGMLSTKLSLWNVLVGALIILAGSTIGGLIAQYVNMTSLYATIIALFIQAILLVLFGFVKGKATPTLKV